MYNATTFNGVGFSFTKGKVRTHFWNADVNSPEQYTKILRRLDGLTPRIMVKVENFASRDILAKMFLDAHALEIDPEYRAEVVAAFMKRIDDAARKHILGFRRFPRRDQGNYRRAIAKQGDNVSV